MTEQNKNNQNNQTGANIDIINKPKRKFWKFTLGFMGIIVGIFILYIAGAWAVRAYQQWQGEKAVQKTVENLKKFEADDYVKAMADTYGGKTPQETLQMYIDAVEKGDYELASKYFIGDKQEEELRSFENSKKENIDNILNLLKQSLKNQGSFSVDKKGFIIRKPLLVDFKLYPNGIWKIIEI
ncbi:DUF4878 domain-containing protein [Candidatus Wolfebacteria bacterium]|nr:DUF4878 domain-containing protein [Candidatus Wolfebacteria bacterium]